MQLSNMNSVYNGLYNQNSKAKTPEEEAKNRRDFLMLQLLPADQNGEANDMSPTGNIKDTPGALRQTSEGAGLTNMWKNNMKNGILGMLGIGGR